MFHLGRLQKYLAYILIHYPRYGDAGKIKIIKNEAGQRLQDVKSYIQGANRASTICYCRVSSAKQRDDLTRHLDDLISRLTKAKSQTKQGMKKATNRLRSKIRNLIDELHHKTALFLVQNFDVILLPTFEVSQMIRTYAGTLYIAYCQNKIVNTIISSFQTNITFNIH